MTQVTDAADSKLDKEPEWMMQRLRPSHSLWEDDHGISASALIKDLTTWHLDDESEASSLTTFKKQGESPGAAKLHHRCDVLQASRLCDDSFSPPNSSPRPLLPQTLSTRA